MLAHSLFKMNPLVYFFQRLQTAQNETILVLGQFLFCICPGVSLLCRWILLPGTMLLEHHHCLTLDSRNPG